MNWDYAITLYLETHCTARGLSSKTITAYRGTMRLFRDYVRTKKADLAPAAIRARDVLDYVNYLRDERGNHACAVNRQVTVLKNFYRALVAMGHLEERENPMIGFPKIKAAPRKVAETLSGDEVQRLMTQPRTDTVMGLRDRALMTLLYATGIRASECAGMKVRDVDFGVKTIHVVGKGGHERVIPLNAEAMTTLAQYHHARGPILDRRAFFQSRRGNGMSRNAIYERVRRHSMKAKIDKRISPHRIRHTFATHLVKKGVDLVTIQHLLGHRSIASTQIYLHTTGEDLRKAAELHPVRHMVEIIANLLPDVKLPFQYPPGRRFG